MADSDVINLWGIIVLVLIGIFVVPVIVMLPLIASRHLYNRISGNPYGGAKRKRGLKLKSNTLCCFVALVAGSLVVLRLVRGEGLL